MIDVSELILDPDFVQPEKFIVTRNAGSWIEGRFVQEQTTIEMSGVIIPDLTGQTQQDAHGDMITGLIKIYTQEPLYTAASDQSDQDRTADEVTWKTLKYKVIDTKDVGDFGYYYAEAVRKLGS